ncbi:hypothetical protein J2R98_002874 [Alkalibacillus filiformis]|uniref:Cytochrome oxidase maturation protein, cbb3-type n=1 Tax=Alkalibacillus filiformis TaxID=200990 RepID=A0ABU0DX32_9BACI|nr:hypothetical protein [Alkalibacillus filiformis]
MSDFLILYAPFITLIGAIALAFWAALKGSHIDGE